MAHPVNEARQKVIELQATINKRVKARDLGPDLDALGDDLQAAREELGKLENEQAGILAEMAAPGYRNRLTGITNGGDEQDQPSAGSNLPALSASARASIARLHAAPRGFRLESAGGGGESRDVARAVIVSAMSGTMIPAQYSAQLNRESDDVAGGFALPSDTAAGIYTRAAEASLWVRLGARIEPMITADKTFVAFDDDDETGGAEAGMTGAFKSEGVASTAQEARLRRVKLHAESHIVYAKVSIELGEDAPDFLPALEGAMGRVLGKRFDRIVLTGLNGVTSGLLTSPALITVSKESGQAAATILWVNIVKMWSRLSPGTHENSVWVVHPTTLPQLLTMSQPIGVAGTIPAAAFASDGRGGYTMMGRPVFVSSRTRALGTAGDVILTDPSQIVIGLRRGITVDRSEHVHFAEGIIALRARMRACAGTIWDAPQTPIEGDTVSPYVVLQTRA